MSRAKIELTSEEAEHLALLLQQAHRASYCQMGDERRHLVGFRFDDAVEFLKFKLSAAQADEGKFNPFHCAKCHKPMQFYDGICFACNGGRDPGD